MKFLLGDMYHSSGLTLFVVFSELDNWFSRCNTSYVFFYKCLCLQLALTNLACERERYRVDGLFNLVKIFILRGDVSIENLQC